MQNAFFIDVGEAAFHVFLRVRARHEGDRPTFGLAPE